jgi:hypothetical protein
MKKMILPFLCVCLSISLSGCGLMEDAFKAGVFFAIVIIAVVGLLVWLLRMGYNQLVKKGIVVDFLNE